MKSLASLRARIDYLLAQRAPESEPPEAIFVLPENGRGPDSDDGLSLPRAHRVGPALVVTYRGEDGPPTGAELAELVRGTT
ncbi:MAG: hypothetical protein JXP73_10240 [Deltaproteobacteria bacterium]|nr:hypothetical protein [Deltaproteobacteria bacterium]